MSSKEVSNKSNKPEEHHETMLESAKHVVDAVTESMFGTSSVFGVLVEPHSELTHPDEQASSKTKTNDDKYIEEHHSTLYESVKHAADSVTESMFESSSVYGVLVEPHSELTHPEERSHSAENETPKEEEHHSSLYEFAKKVSDSVTESMFESSSVYGVLVEPHPELHEHENEVQDEPKKEERGKEDRPDRPWHHLM